MAKPTKTEDVMMLISVASAIWDQHKGAKDVFPAQFLDMYGDFAVEIRATTDEEKRQVREGMFPSEGRDRN